MSFLNMANSEDRNKSERYLANQSTVQQLDIVGSVYHLVIYIVQQVVKLIHAIQAIHFYKDAVNDSEYHRMA